MDKMRCQTSTGTKGSYSGDYDANGIKVTGSLTVAEVKLTKSASLATVIILLKYQVFFDNLDKLLVKK